MRSTKVLLMIVCGMGLSNINAEIIQGITKPENPEILIVNIWVNGLDYNTETVTFLRGIRDLLNVRLWKILEFV